VRVYVYMCVCVCMYICIYAYVGIHTHACVNASKILFSCPLNRLRSGSTIGEMEYMRNRTNTCILKTYFSSVMWKNFGGEGGALPIV